MRFFLLCNFLRCLPLYLPLCLLLGCQTSPKSFSESAADYNYRPQSAVPLLSLDRSGVPSDGRCAGLPRAAVAAVDSSIECIGIIDSSLGFPRGVVEWGEDILVVDKGSHLHQAQLGQTAGRIYRYVATETGYQRSLLVDGLDNPSSLSRGQHPADLHLVYVSTPTAILRFAPDAKDVAAEVEPVVSGLPLEGWHYLSAAYTTARHLYVTVPSASDHCEGFSSNPSSKRRIEAQFPCPEVDAADGFSLPPEQITASIRRYEIGDKGQISKKFTVVARGLRDALALVQLPGSANLLAADNGWDDIELVGSPLVDSDVPRDEINLVELAVPSAPGSSAHFGWPYCYDRGARTPGYEEFPVDCRKYREPLLLLPAHSAPLNMLVHNDQLLVNLHGFEEGGRRTVAFELSESGLPMGPAEVLIDWNFTDQFGYLWGRPFGLATLGPTQLLVTDDWNHALLLVVQRLKDP